MKNNILVKLLVFVLICTVIVVPMASFAESGNRLDYAKACQVYNKCLDRLISEDEQAKYTLISPDHGALDSGTLYTEPFAQMLKYAEFKKADIEQPPKGSCITLIFPDEYQIDYYEEKEENNYFRITDLKSNESILLQAFYNDIDDDGITIYEVMREWSDILAVGFTVV